MAAIIIFCVSWNYVKATEEYAVPNSVVVLSPHTIVNVTAD